MEQLHERPLSFSMRGTTQEVGVAHVVWGSA